MKVGGGAIRPPQAKPRYVLSVSCLSATGKNGSSEDSGSKSFTAQYVVGQSRSRPTLKALPSVQLVDPDLKLYAYFSKVLLGFLMAKCLG